MKHNRLTASKLVLMTLLLGLMSFPTLIKAQDIPSPVVFPTIEATTVSDEVTVTHPALLDELPESNGPPTTDPIVYVIVVVLAVLLVAALAFGAHITRSLATLVPPEVATSIYQAGVQFGLEVALNQAAETETQVDDDFFKKLAADRGLEVTRLPDGRYEVKSI